MRLLGSLLCCAHLAPLTVLLYCRRVALASRSLELEVRALKADMRKHDASRHEHVRHATRPWCTQGWGRCVRTCLTQRAVPVCPTVLVRLPPPSQDDELRLQRGIIDDLTRQRQAAELEVVTVRKELNTTRQMLQAVKRDNAIREGAMQRVYHRRYDSTSLPAAAACSRADTERPNTRRFARSHLRLSVDSNTGMPKYTSEADLMQKLEPEGRSGMHQSQSMQALRSAASMRKPSMRKKVHVVRQPVSAGSSKGESRPAPTCGCCFPTTADNPITVPCCVLAQTCG